MGTREPPGAASEDVSAVEAGFGRWHALVRAELAEHAPDAPAAVQIARADKSLVRYPKGKSTMVFYFYAARSAREALARVFADEFDAPGARGQGALVFRTLVGGDDARQHLERLFDEFIARFGAPPVLHAAPAEDDAPGG